MKTTTLLLILLLPLLGLTQESTKKKLIYGFSLSPNYSYRTLRYSKDIEYLVISREEYEHPGLGFNTGVFGRYSILEDFELELGLQFSKQTHKFKNVPATDAIAFVIGTANTKYNYYFLELPFRINYKFINMEKFIVYSSIGASPNILLNSTEKTRIKYNDGSKSKEKNAPALLLPNRIAFSFLLNVGVGYSLNETMQLRFEPILRYSITALSDAPIQQFNYSVGGQFSLTCEL
jgi:hypothetical protein|tara:strand:+ start:34291 stop:34992 length:702 start_codon:yes stop_codon:yes gene_type:complete